MRVNIGRLLLAENHARELVCVAGQLFELRVPTHQLISQLGGVQPLRTLFSVVCFLHRRRHRIHFFGAQVSRQDSCFYVVDRRLNDVDLASSFEFRKYPWNQEWMPNIFRGVAQPVYDLLLDGEWAAE